MDEEIGVARREREGLVLAGFRSRASVPRHWQEQR
jgi:hypothetical protein